MQCMCDVLSSNQRSLLRYFVTLYFWISQKYLKICPNKFWSVRCVLYTSDKCWGWIQVQTIKNLTLKIEIRNWNPILRIFVYLEKQFLNSFLGNLLKWILHINLLQTIISSQSMKFVHWDHAIGCSVCLLIDHQFS